MPPLFVKLRPDRLPEFHAADASKHVPAAVVGRLYKFIYGLLYAVKIHG
jgi:hypothetical protein